MPGLCYLRMIMNIKITIACIFKCGTSRRKDIMDFVPLFAENPNIHANFSLHVCVCVIEWEELGRI